MYCYGPAVGNLQSIHNFTAECVPGLSNLLRGGEDQWRVPAFLYAAAPVKLGYPLPVYSVTHRDAVGARYKTLCTSC